VVIAAAALASLRFNLYPARLPIGGSGTALLGFLFAVLTVLARQKTIATFLLVLPLGLIVVVIGGYMLTFLERSMSFGSGEGEE
jgi:UDP-N-acetylmuramyl pentapeptide phosphotransferase/UDP-N-acetylglucosamine-1-phosphate transferase